MARLVSVVALIGTLIGLPVALPTSSAQAQVPAVQPIKPRPAVRGRKYRLKIDSSPQQAAVYWDAGPSASPKDYGVAGYTPITLTVPKGTVKVIVELKGFKSVERFLEMRKSDKLFLPLERAPQAAHLEIVAGSDGSGTGAEVSIDGVARGTLPNTFEITAGRHQVEIKKTGWKTQSKWVEVNEDERRTIEAVLERAELPVGSLLVTTDVPGEVWVDGVRRDAAPALVPNLSPGEHVVEVKREGAPPWRQSVTVMSGQQVKVNASVAGGAAGGLRIVSTEPGVEVYVDGELKGPAPVTVSDLKPGQHLVEGRKAQYKTFEQTVEAVPGKQVLVQVRMEAGGPEKGHAILKVQSSIPDAEVFLDGSTLGKAPIDRRDLTPGKHYVTIRRDGYEEVKREVFLIDGQPIDIAAELRAVGHLRILSSPQGADVTIDGEPVGKTPLEKDDVQAGDHVFVFRLKGYYEHKETISVVGGKERLISPELKALPNGPSPEQMAKRKAGMSSFGAKVHPVGGFTADLGVGYPNILMMRLTVGAFNVKPLGLDLGIEGATFFQMWTLAIHGRLQLVEAGPLAVAIRTDLGGGTGTSGRDTLFFDSSAIASLAFADIVTFSASVKFSAWSDRFCPSQKQIDNGIEGQDYCAEGTWQTVFGANNDPKNTRFSDSRIYAGIAVTAALDRLTSLFLSLEFLPLPNFIDYDARMAYQDQFNSIMFKKDTFVYGNAGVTLKF